jgi:pimeloyl-ACP methyl ester carboxylesterase
MATFVLIHGAWHGAWCWERVTPLLTQRGHTVSAPDLPGLGQDRTPLGSITLDLWARFTADLVRAAAEPVILVGHSRGGIVISQAAEQVSDRIRALVYVAAFLVPSGESLASTLPRVPREPGRPPDLLLSEDRSTSVLRAESVPATFYNTTAEDWVARAGSLVGTESMKPWLTPMSLTEEKFGRVPRVYIECLRDRAIPPTLQRLMVADLPCSQVLVMDTDHSPFYSAPETLVVHLASIAEAA